MKNLGIGVGLRSDHYQHFLNSKPASIDWVEVISENFMIWDTGCGAGKIPLRPVQRLEKIRQNVPVALHGVSMSIGSADPINFDYLRKLKDLASRIEPAWISDHLCWTGVQGENLHDLLPLPYTEEAVQHVVNRIRRVQDYLNRKILIENVSSYAEFSHSTMTEWEFLTAIAEQADCEILLDVNNVYVSAINHGFNPLDYLRAVPAKRVGQIHLAGHSNEGTHCIDTHDEPVCDAVWALYRWVVQNMGQFSTMVEWDDNIPEWQVLEDETKKARAIYSDSSDLNRPPQDRSKDINATQSFRPSAPL